MKRFSILIILALFFSISPLSAKNKENLLPSHFRLKVLFKNLNAPKVEQFFNANSELLHLAIPLHDKDKGKINEALEKDTQLLKELLNTYFFFDHKLDIDSQRNQGVFALTFKVHKGPRYHLKAFHLDCTHPQESSLPLPTTKELGLKLATASNNYVLQEAQEKLLAYYQNQGHPFVDLYPLELQVNPEDKSVEVFQRFRTYPSYIFGPVNIPALPTLPQSLIKKMLRWKEGELFSIKKIEDSKASLQSSGWFSFVHISFPQEIDSSHALPIYLQLREEKHRDLNLGISFNTQQQLGFLIDFEHRNVSQKGYYFNGRGEFSKLKKQMQLHFIHPGRWNKNTSFGLMAGGVFEKVNANIENRKVYLQPYLKHHFSSHLNGVLGLRLERVEDHVKGPKEIYPLLALPLKLSWASSNYMKEKWQIKGNWTPVYNANLTKNTFASSLLNIKKNTSLGERGYLSFWGNFGLLTGASLPHIPSSYRFYGGSGKWLKGYRYHSVPYNFQTDEATGGKGLYTLGAEWHIPLYKPWQAHLFIESGRVEPKSAIHFQKKPLKSAGFGVSYVLGSYPVKLECALPLDRRKKSQSKYLDTHLFHLYLQLGEGV